MSKFQLILILFFGLAIGVALVIMAISKGGSSASVGNVVIWGTEDQGTFDAFVKSVYEKDETVSVTYVQKSRSAFDQSLITAIADGVAPDAILLPESSILKYQDRIYQIPFANYPLRQFKDTFIQGAEIFLGQTGVIALPLSVDPLVMYWNRDIFANAGIALPPKYWDETLLLPKVLTKKNQNGTLNQSALALGEYFNIENSKNILSGLFMQLGNPLVYKSGQGQFASSLPENPSVVSALRFYTDFSNPTSPLYSWNRSMSNDKNSFVGGKLAIYFGKASELRNIRDKNPNLNFDVSYFPQLRDSDVRIVPASLEGLAVMKNSRNLAGALAVAVKLSNADSAKKWSDISLLPPLRRDLLASKPSDSFLSIFYDSALWAKGWLDPNQNSTSAIYSDLVENVTTGGKNYQDALKEAGDKISNLLMGVSQ